MTFSSLVRHSGKIFFQLYTGGRFLPHQCSPSPRDSHAAGNKFSIFCLCGWLGGWYGIVLACFWGFPQSGCECVYADKKRGGIYAKKGTKLGHSDSRYIATIPVYLTHISFIGIWWCVAQKKSLSMPRLEQSRIPCRIHIPMIEQSILPTNALSYLTDMICDFPWTYLMKNL